MGNSSLQKPKLLIAEDDIENQKFLDLFLKKYFFINICDSSDSFYELMAKNKYDVILMDISLKGDKDGLTLARELKSNSDTKNIPIICYTAHAANTDRLNALDAGCNAYISKPADIYILLNSLFSVLKSDKQDLSEPNTSAGFVLA
jgi:DNA-binding response OmpR family regulator